MRACFLLILSVLAVVPAQIGRGQIGFRQPTCTHPVAVQRGTAATVQLRCNYTLDDAYAVFSDPPGVRMTYLETAPIDPGPATRTTSGAPFRFQVEVPEDQLPGVVEYRIATKQAVSSVAQLLVTDFPVVIEQESENGTPETAQLVPIPAAICGVCEKFEDVDCYRISGQQGQTLTFQIFAQRVTDRIHGMVVRGPRIYLMDPILTLIGPNGQVVAQNDNYVGGDSLIHVQLPVEGEYVLEVRDARYAGDPRYVYCVEVSSQPLVHTLFPLAVQQGTTASPAVIGEQMQAESVPLNIDNSRLGWQQVRISLPGGLSNPLPLLVSPHPQIIEHEPNNDVAAANEITLPTGINGRMDSPDDVDMYRFSAVKGQLFRFEIESARQGMPLDSVLELYDAEGTLLTEADDMTAPRAKDSQLFWTAPKDGNYVIAVRDLHGRGGARFVYHLRAEQVQPDFELFGEFYYAMLAPGVRTIWFARIERRNGFKEPVRIEVEGLPSGVEAAPVTIPAGMNHCAIILSAKDDAPLNASLVRVIGRATVSGEEGASAEMVRRAHITCEQQSSGGGQARWPIQTQLVAVTKPLDLTQVVATPTEIVLGPRGSAEIQVQIQRSPEFKEAISLATTFDYFTTKFGEQLPPGVTMSSKSAVRLTGDILEGKIILEANEKPLPVDRLPIAVMARVAVSFSITTNYASNPVYLTVTGETAATAP